jgi:hypothetical protein
MDCEEIKRVELLEQYLTAKLPADAQDELETHLLECAACSRELELLLLARSELSQHAAEIRAKSVEKFSFLHWQTLAFAGVLVIVLVGISYRLGHRIPDHQGRNEAASTLPHPSGGAQVDRPAPKDSSPSAFPQLDSNAGRTVTPREKLQVPVPVNPQTSDQGPTELAHGAQLAPPATANGNALPEPGPVMVPPKQEQAASTNLETHPGGLTTAQGVELYKLGQVQPPAYAFTGLTSKSGPPVGKPTAGYSGAGNAGGPGRAKFQEAMKSYVAGKYGEGADYLSDAAILEPKAADINFYLGACRILIGHPQDSVEPLQQAAAAGNTPYLQSSHYYLAKAYVQMNQLEKAMQELQSAANTPGRLTTESKQLLAKVQALQASINKN